MKKFMLFTLALLVFGVSVVRADDDQPIKINQLPEKAQQFIQKHFSKEKVAYAKMERDFMDVSYEVVFTSGTKLEFLKNGNWKEVDCKYSTLPTEIVPQEITKYVSENYPDVKMVKIDRDKRDYEVKLNNKLELTFDLKFNLIDIDD